MFTPHHKSHVRCEVSYITCHVSLVTCHVSHITCHVSHVTIIISFFFTMWLILPVEGALSTGPTPSSLCPFQHNTSRKFVNDFFLWIIVIFVQQNFTVTSKMSCYVKSHANRLFSISVLGHLCFKQAQPKMCHSPKVDDKVFLFFFTSWIPIFRFFFVKNFKLP